jgi:23S rRNA pseudouridine2605 synthase
MESIQGTDHSIANGDQSQSESEPTTASPATTAGAKSATDDASSDEQNFAQSADRQHEGADIGDDDAPIFEDGDDEDSDETSGGKRSGSGGRAGFNPPKPSKVRLNKLIADSGLASRRAADRMIEEGLITVNGKKVYELGIKVDPNNDHIFLQGKPLRKKFEHLYIMFHKPKGVLTTMEDPLERPTIKKYLEEIPTRVFPVGRLDWDSEGLLLLTNDGDFANRVTHPKEEVTKTYLVKVDGKPTEDKLQKLLNGVSIVGGKVSAKSVEKVKRGKDQYDWLKIVITEGKNRQIRQMFEKIGFDVLKLQRVAIGRLRLGNLERGELVYLNDVAAERVFQQDMPEMVKEKKSYKGRSTSPKAAGKPVRSAKGSPVIEPAKGRSASAPAKRRPARAGKPAGGKAAFGRPSAKSSNKSRPSAAFSQR